MALQKLQADHVKRMHCDVEIMTRQLELEKRRLQRLEKEVGAAKKTHDTKLRQRADLVDTMRPHSARQSALDTGLGRTSPEASERPRAASAGRGPPLRTLLSRLEVQRRKLDQMQFGNSDLRRDIDAVRRERSQLSDVFERLRAEIQRKSALLLDWVEETAASQHVRGDALQRITVMRRHRELERGQFKKEVRKLTEQLQLHDWEKKEVDVQLKRQEAGVQKKRELVIPEEERGFSENDMTRRILKNAFLNCTQRRKIKQHQKSIEVFEQAFSTIKQSTGIEQIEEIVSIFTNLESRNFSLLTYVNEMHREIEALEAQRQERQGLEERRVAAELRREQARQEALADVQRQTQAAQGATASERGSYVKHRELVATLRPLLLQIAARIQREIGRLRSAGPEDFPRQPGELLEETIPEWLEWIELSLGRWRDLLPGVDRDGPFPCTAASRVRALPPKRFGTVQLVKAQDLPSAQVHEASGRPGHVGLTAQQKAELLDEESEEEDFADRPLMLKDLRSRAEQATQRRRRRQGKTKGEAPAAVPAIVAEERREEAPSCHEERPERVEEAQAEPAPKDGEELPVEEVSEEELSNAILKRYKMSREELQLMADRMGIHIMNLVFLKQEFDLYDEDKSGYIDAQELKGLLKKLGEELTDEQLDQAFRDLDSDGSGEVEFFEFVSWFTSAN